MVVATSEITASEGVPLVCVGFCHARSRNLSFQCLWRFDVKLFFFFFFFFFFFCLFFTVCGSVPIAGVDPEVQREFEGLSRKPL